MAVSPIHFIDYNKISDSLMWFDSTHVLKFCVVLQKKDKKGDIVPFHKEFSFMNKSNNTEQLTIVRDYSFYYIIEDIKNKGNFTANNTSILLHANDVELLRILLERNLYPWFLPPTRDKIFGKDNMNRLIVKGNQKVQFPVTNRSYLEFRPTIIEYENTDEQKEGVRLIMNDIDNFIDISIDKFMEFGNYIIHTDMINAAMNMLTYVKLRPYGTNLFDFNQQNTTTNYIATPNNNRPNYSNNNKKGFF